MQTVMIRLTRRGGGTVPGGVILRKRGEDEYIVHNFERKAGSVAPLSFHVGSYFTTGDVPNRLVKAVAEFERRCARAESYGTNGGGLIPEELERAVLSGETEEQVA